MMDVAFYEVFAEEATALKRYLPASVKASFTQDILQASGEESAPASLISVRTQSTIPESWFQVLSGVLTRSTGFDHLRAFQAESKNLVPCGYLPLYCARAVSEHAFLTLLSLLRHFKQQIAQFSNFDRNHLTGSECLDRTLLVVGVGNIGSEIARLGRALGMHVKGVDLVKRVKNLEYVDLNKGIQSSEVVICALPLTKLTRGMLGYEVLKKAKPGAIFINISRGEISPAKDLKKLLEEGALGGVGLDIYEDEATLANYLQKKGKPTKNNQAALALKDDPRVLLTPHNAFNTREALERKARQSAESVTLFLKTQKFSHPVPAD